MARTWSRQEGDLKILEALHKYKYLRGKVLTKISGYTQAKGHDRISALKRQGLIIGEAYVKQEKAATRVVNKKVAAIYYLTTKGLVTIKTILGEEVNGEERGRKPSEEEKERAYRASLLLEGLSDIYDTFSAPAGYKIKQDIPNFVPIGLVNRNTLIFFDKPEKSRNMISKIVTECHRLQERFQSHETLILTTDERKRNNFVSYSIEHYGQTERILAQDDYTGIRYLLAPDQEFKNYFISSGIEIEELDKPYDGCSYIIDREMANIFDVVGLPAKTLRRVKRTNGKIYLLVSNDRERKTLYKHYPEYQDNEDTVVIELGRQILLNHEAFTIKEEPLQGEDKWAKALQGYASQN